MRVFIAFRTPKNLDKQLFPVPEHNIIAVRYMLFRHTSTMTLLRVNFDTRYDGPPTVWGHTGIEHFSHDERDVNRIVEAYLNEHSWKSRDRSIIRRAIRLHADERFL